MHPNRLRAVALVLLAVGALGTLAALVTAGDGLGVFSGAGIGFALWAVAPYAALAGVVARFWSPRARLTEAVGAATIVLGALALYAEALWLNPDAQGALAFVFVPVVQFAVVLLTLGIAAVVHRGAAA